MVTLRQKVFLVSEERVRKHVVGRSNCEPYRDLLAGEKPPPAANRPRELQRRLPSIVPGGRRRWWRLGACARDAWTRRERSGGSREAEGCFLTRAACGLSLFHPTSPHRLYSICSDGGIWDVGSAWPASGGSCPHGVLRLLGPGRAASPGTTAGASARRRRGRGSRWWRRLRRQWLSHVSGVSRACGRDRLCSLETGCYARCECGSGDGYLAACQMSSPHASLQCATRPHGRAAWRRAGRRDGGKGRGGVASTADGARRKPTYTPWVHELGTAPLQLLLPKKDSCCRLSMDRHAQSTTRSNARSRAAR